MLQLQKTLRKNPCQYTPTTHITQHPTWKTNNLTSSPDFKKFNSCPNLNILTPLTALKILHPPKTPPLTSKIFTMFFGLVKLFNPSKL
jgi:hypothetical protein